MNLRVLCVIILSYNTIAVPTFFLKVHGLHSSAAFQFPKTLFGRFFEKPKQEIPLQQRRNLEDRIKTRDNDLKTNVADENDPEDDPLSGTRIGAGGRIINKKRKLYSIGNLQHVDDFFIGKYHVEWTVRGVWEKLQFRFRGCKSPPLKTSRFAFAGIKGFILKLWLDGHSSSEPGYMAVSLLQEEHWDVLESPIEIYAGDVTRGPFYYKSPEYSKTVASLCKLKDAVKDNELVIGVKIATRN